MNEFKCDTSQEFLTIGLFIIYNIPLILMFWLNSILDCWLIGILNITIIIPIIIYKSYKYISKVVINDDKIIINKIHREFIYEIKNINVVEQIRYTKSARKYYNLIIKSDNPRNKFVLDSDDWESYEIIKNTLREHIENKI